MPAPCAPQCVHNPPGRFVGLRNHAWVTDGVHRSEQPAVRDFQALRQIAGIRTVINLRARDTDLPLLAATGMSWKAFHLRTSPSDTTDDDFLRAVKVLSTPEFHPVLVHCRRGADRTGLAVGLLRMLNWGCSYDCVREELVTFGRAWVWRNIDRRLKRWTPAELRSAVDAIDLPPVREI